MLSFPLSFAYVLTVASATPSARGTSLKFVPPRIRTFAGSATTRSVKESEVPTVMARISHFEEPFISRDFS